MQDGDGDWSVKSGAFSDSSDGSGMSVHRALIAHEHSIAMEDLLPEPKDQLGMVSLDPAGLRALGLGAVPDPLVEDPTHALVTGRKSGSMRRKIRDIAMILRVPPHLDG